MESSADKSNGREVEVCLDSVTTGAFGVCGGGGKAEGEGSVGGGLGGDGGAGGG
eukprot:CAMPEP_0119102208 /NCGR_PEP_ID=MMETSP1180-20130426/1032_1 /TAXON_ID=3052 ORGANISM="Chlamydomonas cf sp, Strain CCMP681" /NCGR_SAMPLE_ID=MMETSP1180 /ASSEMBLY_ACC=CAM_ASM_000741 /LENGTH=53 /DNA_ID=CAMNT_0007086451 /DNA_START=760 /DNA_END=921 /DNA_ORIENTATION=-